MSPGSGLPVAFLLILLLSPPVAAATEKPQPTEPIGWLEVTPLDSDAPAELLPIEREGRPGRMPATTGRVLACQAFEESAILCEKIVLDAGRSIEIRRVEGVTVRGAVVLGREPVRGARVSVLPAAVDALRRFLMPLSWDAPRKRLLRDVRSDERGQFSLPPIAPGRYLLEVQSPGGRLLHGEPFRVPEPSELRGRMPVSSGPLALDLGEVRFAEGLRIEVQVVDGEGVPVAGARVGASQGRRPEEARFFEARTSSAGLASIEGVEPLVRTGLSCSAEGYQWHQEEFEEPPATFSCVLERLAMIEGTIVAFEGSKPLGQATVALEGPALELPAGRFLSRGTDAEGAFDFSDLPAGKYRLTAAAAGFESRSLEVELRPGERRDLEKLWLEQGSEWRGRVIDSATGEGIEGARVTALRPPGAFSAVTGDEGGFQTVSAVGEHLTIEVAAEGYPRTVLSVRAETLRADEEPILEIARGGQVRVVVWNAEEDSPCQFCPVLITAGGRPPIRLQTGGDGTVLSDLLPPGEYRVLLERVRSLGSIVQRSGGDDSQLARVHSLQTTEVSFGDRSANLLVRFRPQPAAGWSLLADGPAGSKLYPIEGGSLRIPRPLGRTRLALANSSGTTVQLALLPADFSNRTIDLTVPRSEVRGSLAAEARTAAQILVWIVSVDTQSIRATFLTGADGRFAIPFLAPGTYFLVANQQRVRSFRLDAEAPLDLGILELPSTSDPGAAPSQRTQGVP